MGKEYHSIYGKGDIIRSMDDEEMYILEEPERFNDKFYFAKAADAVSGRKCFLKFANKNAEQYKIANLSREGMFKFSFPYIEQVYGNFYGKMPSGKAVFGVSLEFVDGCNLTEYRKTEHDETIYFLQILQLLHAMKYYTGFAYDTYLHRDIKPDNIMITDEGIKLVDFDYAHEAGSRKTEDVSAAGRSWNIPFSAGYSSPEIFTAKPEKHTLQTEIYAAGRTIFFWLNGRDYYDDSQCVMTGTDVQSTVYCTSEKLRYGFKTNENRFNPVYLEAKYSLLLEILEKMCASPDSPRYESVDEIIEDMERFLLGYCGNSPKKYAKHFGGDNLAVLQNPSPLSSRNSVMVGYKAEDNIKIGYPLYEYSMRDIAVNGRQLLTIYNIDDTVYFIPAAEVNVSLNGRNVISEYQIHDKDKISCNGTEIEFSIEEKRE